MALTPKEIEDTLRLKMEIETNPQGMRPDLDRLLPVASEALRLEEQWRRMAPTQSLVEELARGHEEIERFARTSSVAEEIGRTARELKAAGMFTAAARLSEEYKRMAPVTVGVVSGLQAAIAAFEGSSILKAARAFENSPILAAARAFDNSAIAQLARALNENPLLNTARAFDGGIVAQLAKGFENLGPLNLNAALAAQFAGMREVVLSPKFQSIVAAARTSDSFIDRMAADVATLVATEDDEAVAAFESGFAQWIAGLPHNSLVQGFVMNLLFLVLGIWIQSCISAKSEARNAEVDDRRHQAVLAAVGRLAEQAQHLAPLSDQVQHIAVLVRALNVRVAPDRQAQRIDILNAGQQVNIVGRVNRWLEIEYLDDEADVHKGWIAARWVKKVEKD